MSARLTRASGTALEIFASVIGKIASASDQACARTTGYVQADSERPAMTGQTTLVDTTIRTPASTGGLTWARRACRRSALTRRCSWIASDQLASDEARPDGAIASTTAAVMTRPERIATLSVYNKRPSLNRDEARACHIDSSRESPRPTWRQGQQRWNGPCGSTKRTEWPRTARKSSSSRTLTPTSRCASARINQKLAHRDHSDVTGPNLPMRAASSKRISWALASVVARRNEYAVLNG